MAAAIQSVKNAINDIYDSGEPWITVVKEVKNTNGGDKPHSVSFYSGNSLVDMSHIFNEETSQVNFNLNPSSISGQGVQYSEETNSLFFTARFAGKPIEVVVPLECLILIFDKSTAGIRLHSGGEEVATGESERTRVAQRILKVADELKVTVFARVGLDSGNPFQGKHPSDFWVIIKPGAYNLSKDGETVISVSASSPEGDTAVIGFNEEGDALDVFFTGPNFRQSAFIKEIMTAPMGVESVPGVVLTEDNCVFSDAEFQKKVIEYFTPSPSAQQPDVPSTPIDEETKAIIESSSNVVVGNFGKKR